MVKSFRAFLMEMPQIFRSSLPKSEIKTDSLDEPEKGAHKIGEFGNYHLYKKVHHFDDEKGVILSAVHKDKKKTHVKIVGMEKGKTFSITSLNSTKDNEIRGHELYHHLITKHGLTLQSHRMHSEGGMKTWKKLREYPDIHISHVDSEGKELEMHSDFEKNYGDERTHFIAKKKK